MIYYRMLESEKPYKHPPEPKRKTIEASIRWNIAIQSDRKIKSNRPDIEVKEFERKICFPTDMIIYHIKNIKK